MKYFTLIILLLCSSCKKEKNTFYSLDEYSLKGTQYYDIKKDKGPYIFLKRHKDSLYVSILGIEKDKSFTRIYTNEGNYWYSEMKREIPMSQTDLNTPIWKTQKRYVYNDTIMTYEYYTINDSLYKFPTLEFETRHNKILFNLSDKFLQKISFKELKNLFFNYQNKFNYMQYNVLGNNISYRYYNKIKINDTLYIYEKSDTSHYKIGQLRDVLKLGNLGEFGIQFEEYKSIYYDIDIALFK